MKKCILRAFIHTDFPGGPRGPLKILQGPLGGRGPQFRNRCAVNHSLRVMYEPSQEMNANVNIACLDIFINSLVDCKGCLSNTVFRRADSNSSVSIPIPPFLKSEAMGVYPNNSSYSCKKGTCEFLRKKKKIQCNNLKIF
uniref:Uncharacterized protein n=1 Tax=Cacopsylla melanoneura TaxID=428564 RepID=A0A8D8XSB7_9HEMI